MVGGGGGGVSEGGGRVTPIRHPVVVYTLPAWLSGLGMR